MDRIIKKIDIMQNSLPRIKICGITRPQDGVIAAQLGANAIGLVFYAKSPRAVSIEQANAIIQTLPPFITTVGLFVNENMETVKHILSQVPLDRLQFHGDETPDYCNSFTTPYLKAIRMKPDIDLLTVEKQYAQSRGLLLDTYVKGTAGGTGETFDWARVPDNLTKPIILAGGLTIENVQQAVNHLHPYALDVSSGVELNKGIKDENKIKQFIEQVYNI